MTGPGGRRLWGPAGAGRASPASAHAARGRKLIEIVAGETDDGAGAEQFAGVGGREIVLAHVQAGLEQHGEIGAVVDDERRARFPAQAGHLPGGFKNVAAPASLVAGLEDG